ncbi:MAG: acyl transferase [Chitinophagales bacterium]
MTNARFWEVTEANFESAALEVFAFQYERIAIYRAFCNSLGRNPARVGSFYDIPFLPVSFFKTHRIAATEILIEKTFESSTTGGGLPSKHEVESLAFYETSFLKGFENFYGNVEQYGILALLPSYMERGTSSLLYMTEQLIRKSNCEASDFFKDDFQKLTEAILKVRQAGKRPFLLGVTYALLDFAATFPQDLSDCIIMETGGMKGRRAELTRDEVHGILKKSFGVKQIHSEYGMTELLSQAYSKGEGIFQCQPWMRVLVRDSSDPLCLLRKDGSGALNIIDLANYFSCSFIATEDAGRIQGTTFEVIGRLDHTDVRGCNLMY